MSTRFGPSEGKCEVCTKRVGYDVEVVSDKGKQLVRLNICDPCRYWVASELIGTEIKP